MTNNELNNLNNSQRGEELIDDIVGYEFSKSSWTVEEYYKIRDDVYHYLHSPEYLNRITDYEALSSEHKKIVDDVVRDVYERAKSIEPKISRDLISLVIDERAYLISFEHRLKTIAGLQRKIIADSKDYNGSYKRAAYNICDSVRYTIVIPDDEYILKVDEYLHRLESMGYDVIDVKNNWGKPAYQGINVRLAVSENNDLFELQFHTPVGYQIKEGNTRDLYQVIREESAPLELKTRANNLRILLQTKVIAPVDALGYQYDSEIKRR